MSKSVKNPSKATRNKHAAQCGHSFDCDWAHVLHHVKSCIFLEFLYINLKIDTVSDECEISHNVSKHKLNSSFTWFPRICHHSAWFRACIFVSSPPRFFHYWSLFSAYFHTICCIALYSYRFVYFYVQILPIFIAWLYRPLSPPGVFILHFSNSTFTVTYCHLCPVMWWLVLCFFVCTSHCSLLVIAKLHVICG